MMMYICAFSENGNDFNSGSELDTEDELEIARKVCCCCFFFVFFLLTFKNVKKKIVQFGWE